jgi:hypothetical protein
MSVDVVERDAKTQFEELVRQVSACQDPSGALPSFREFLDALAPLIQRRAAAVHRALRSLQTLAGTMPSFDIFDVFGIQGHENRYTDALGWLMATNEVGDRLGRALVAAASPRSAAEPPKGRLCEVTREVLTNDGRVDLVLEFDDAVVGVEVKVWTLEHLTPGGRPQTEAYPAALTERQRIRGRPKRVICVLVTPDGTAPANPESARLSFSQLAATILREGIRGRREDQQLVARQIGFHFLAIGSLSRGGSVEFLREELPDEISEQWLHSHITNLLTVGDIDEETR